MKKSVIIGLVIFALILTAAFVSGVSKEEEDPVEHKEMVALGDSLTRGVGDSGEGYADNLQTLLSEDQHHTVTVYNYGIPGQQSDGLLNQLNTDSELIEKISEAEYVMIFIGTNDLIQSNGGDLEPIQEDLIAKGKQDYSNNIKEILGIIRKNNSEAPVLMLGLFNPYPDSKEVNDVVTDWNETTWNLIKEDEGVKLISTNGLFEEKSEEYFDDALHPNDKGYNLITEEIVKEYDF
ncbi:GDSL-type esterase/lipase family protein [Jeotgalibacillus proteolyticus]|uniref:SGNH hydrolase-type esterase domain-containing protein n=1 Tax=Jeotgalibacillus proteolyticus TaxID=2082395 RepID=A0A2S5GDV5_9BACL|nr:GDSL-type esterase/lipase family protein [Jeotgalibacillus proteolyticus]PPA71176.1 hypothetical protein C4B60_03660 [Jeotgalibacillus proteolyticus]